MEITISDHRRIDIIVLNGRIDSSTTDEFVAAINHQLDKGPRHTVIDLEQVYYLISSGVRGLINAFKRMQRHGARLLIAAPSPCVRQVVQPAGLNILLEIHDEQVEAVGSI